jgi:hypothetical protein
MDALRSGIAVVIVLDTSGSTGEDDRLTVAKKTFADVIYPRLKAARQRVEYSIIEGSGTPREAILVAYQELSASHCADKYIFILTNEAGVPSQDIVAPTKSQDMDVGIYVVYSRITKLFPCFSDFQENDTSSSVFYQ